MDSYSETEIREHYQELLACGFEVKQGNDPVDEDDFVVISQLPWWAARVDLYRGTRSYSQVEIGRF